MDLHHAIMAEPSEQADILVFYVNGKRVAEHSPDPSATLLQYLRRKLLLPGTKEGCGHGGCGSCTVMVSKYDVIKKAVIHYSVNACLFPLCAAHGLAITTVEGVGNPRTGLHEVQKRLVETHGLQCGFCTPGFVMSAFTLLRNNQQPTRDDVERALEGNLCRCTGYRPILEAFSVFTKEVCELGPECCKNKVTPNGLDSDETKGQEIISSDVETQVPIFPPELQLTNNYNHSPKGVHFHGSNMTWYRPSTLTDLVTLKDKFPDAPIIMGNTTVAKHLKQGKFPNVIYSGGLVDFKAVEVSEKDVTFGAATTLSELREQIGQLSTRIEEHNRRHFPSLLAMIERYGSDQIRNVATIGGSIQSGRSNSDVTVLLMALNASVTLASVNGKRIVPLEHLLLKENEVIFSITLPFTKHEDVIVFHKQTDRRTFSLAGVNSGMYVRLDGNTVKEMRMCFGGVCEKAILISKAVDQAFGRSWDDALLHDTMSCMTEELSEQKSGEGTYDLSVASAFLFKFFTAVKNVTIANKTEQGLLENLPMPPCTSTQLYHPCTDEGQPESDAVGRPVPNVASEAIVSGDAVYIDDIPAMQGELFLSLVLSTKPHAKLIRIDPSEALRIGGVHSFVDHRNIPGRNLFGSMAKDEEYFASRKVVYVGQPVGAILAETRELAHRAARLVKVEYDDLQPILTIEDAVQANSYLCQPMMMDDGDVEKAFAESTHVIEGEYNTGFQEHFYMEPQSALVVPKGEHDEMEVFVSTQGLMDAQESISSLLNVQRNKVTCRTKRVGGGFGGKEARTQIIIGPTALAAYLTRRPVRCVLPRETDMLITGKRHPVIANYKVGVDKAGAIKALDINLHCNGGCSMDASLIMIQIAVNSITGCYNIPNIRCRGYACKTNLPSNTSMRGFGKPQAQLIIEDIVFQIACKLQITQEKVRETNLIKEGHVTAWGQSLTNVNASEVLNTCMVSSDFQNRRKEVDILNRKTQWKKRGLAMTTFMYGIGVGIITFNQGAALVNVYLDGSVLVAHGGIEMGQGLNTKLIQVASRVLGVPMEKIHTVETSSATVPNTIVTAGSFGTDFYAPAVMDACRTLNERLGPVKVKHPDATWETLVQNAFAERVQLSATGFNKPKMDVNFDMQKKIGKPSDYYTYGAFCSEVEIDVLTGENQVLQTDIVFDVGKSLNPAIDIGQIEGAFVQGLGMVTSEFMEADENGRLTNCSPLSYKIPNVRSIPRKLNVTLLKNYNVETPVYSSKGIGEPPFLGSVSVLMAIKDAVLAARAEIGLHGYFRLDSPATVTRIKEACGDQLKK